MSYDDTTPLTPEEEETVRAAEYVLGLMEGDLRAAFEVEMGRSPALRARVALWAEDFAAMTDSIAGQDVPPHVWQAITDRIWDETPPERAGLWRRWGLGEVLAGSLVAAGLAFLVYQSDLLAPPPPGYLAEIGAPSDPVRFLAAWDPQDGTLSLEQQGAPAPAGRSYELWLIAGSAAPVSLTVWPADTRTAEIPLPQATGAMLPGAVLAISEEPEGGSPTGQPTGPVVATGQVVLQQL